jgi:Dual specificity phosphatase, catalytic domain
MFENIISNIILYFPSIIIMSQLISLIKNNIIRDVKIVYENITDPKSTDSYNQIIPGLYLGNYDGACSKTFIMDKDINLVINCSNDLDFPDFYSNITHNGHFRYIRIPLDDSDRHIDQMIMEISLPKICPIIHNYLNQGLNVYVHCYAGMQRSATVVICYLMYADYIEKKRIQKLKSYYQFLKSKRVVVFRPDPTFEKVIYSYHDKLLKQV